MAQRTLKRAYRRARNRKMNATDARFPGTVLGLVSRAFVTPAINITTSTPMVLSGVPQILTNTSKLPISASLTSPTVLHLVYDTPGSATSITIPQNDPHVRSTTGGYLPAGTFPLP